MLSDQDQGGLMDALTWGTAKGNERVVSGNALVFKGVWTHSKELYQYVGLMLLSKGWTVFFNSDQSTC